MGGANQYQGQSLCQGLIQGEEAHVLKKGPSLREKTLHHHWPKVSINSHKLALVCGTRAICSKVYTQGVSDDVPPPPNCTYMAHDFCTGDSGEKGESDTMPFL